MTPSNFAIVKDLTKDLTPEDKRFLDDLNEEIYKYLPGQEPIDVNAIEKRLLLLKHLGGAISILEDCSQATARLKHAVHDARHNNLRVMVMGTMKAGKSTTLCALIGYSLALIRNSGATSIPIGYVYAPNSKQPHLEVPENFNENTRRGLESVKKRILEETLSEVQSKLNSHPQAKALLKEIQEESIDELLTLPAEGKSEQICKYVEKISDYYRIFSILEVEGITTTDYPKVFTPFYGISGEPNGTCTLIDTPGCNDTDGFDFARFQEVLDSSQKTLLIVNYLSDLGASAFENNVKPLCQKIIEQRGAHNLIVVVTHIDGRKSKSDTTTEQIVELFKAQLGVTQEQIIEVSSLKALSSSSFRRALSISPPSTPLKEIESVREIAEFAHGELNWEQWLETASRDDALKAADQLWERSGFARLVEAIETTIEDSGKETFKAALTEGVYSLGECPKGISKSKEESRSKQENIEKTAALQLKEIADSVMKLDNLRVCYVNHFRETYENETATILSSSLKFDNADEAKNHLEQSKQACLQTADRVWDRIQQDLIKNFQEVQQQIIDRGKEIGLEFPPVTLDGCTIAFSIDELLDPFYEPEEYQIQVAVQGTKWIKVHRRDRKWSEKFLGIGHYYWVDWYEDQEVPCETIETITNTRPVFVLQRDHKDRTIDLVNSQVSNCLESPALKEALSLSTFNVQLDQHLTKTREDYESNHRSLTLLQSRAEDQLALIQTDLGKVNS